MVERINKLARASRRLLPHLGRQPTEAELAEEMGITPEQVREIIEISRDTLSLEMPIGEDEDSVLGNLVEDKEAISPLDVALLAMLHNDVDRRRAGRRRLRAACRKRSAGARRGRARRTVRRSAAYGW